MPWRKTDPMFERHCFAQDFAILAPGTYAVWCWIPSEDGSPHYMKGSVQR